MCHLSVEHFGVFGSRYFRSIYSAAAGAEFDGETVYRALPWKAWGWVDGQEISFTDPDVAVATNLRRDSSNTVVTEDSL